MHPRWDEYFGSAGRAAAAMAGLGVSARLHGFADVDARASMEARTILGGFGLVLSPTPRTPGFHYIHGLSTPIVQKGDEHVSLDVTADRVLRFGMIEGDARVSGRRVVYDPQDAVNPQSFRANGSTADELAIVLNRHEAALLLGRAPDDAEQMARELAARERASIVVIKQGPRGAFVLEDDVASRVPAYRTPAVWKIGSGDQFAANFAAAWLGQGLSAHAAADRASKATAYYCAHMGAFPDSEALDAFDPMPIQIGPQWVEGKRPLVYLAGPFFNLSQLWLVEQARTALIEMGLPVFSPFHDVGRGSAQDVVSQDLDGIKEAGVVLAIADGMDAGTVYEIGYARALGCPVVVYSECETVEDRKMMEGSGCILVEDFVSAIYHTVWEAAGV
jgi:nucleoside 2-deoxyribosyltransferase